MLVKVSGNVDLTDDPFDIRRKMEKRLASIEFQNKYIIPYGIALGLGMVGKGVYDAASIYDDYRENLERRGKRRK